MKTIAERKELLDQRLEKERREFEEDLEIEEALGLEGEYNYTITRQTGHMTVLVKPGTSAFNAPTFGQAVEIMRHFSPRMAEVPFFKRSGFRAVWMPEEINYAALDGGEKQKGSAVLNLRQTGNQYYRSREFSFWSNVPGIGWLDVHLQPSALPAGWQTQARYKGFSSIDGAVTSWTCASPALLSGEARKGATEGSWDTETYWESWEQFMDTRRQ